MALAVRIVHCGGSVGRRSRFRFRRGRPGRISVDLLARRNSSDESGTESCCSRAVQNDRIRDCVQTTANCCEPETSTSRPQTLNSEIETSSWIMMKPTLLLAIGFLLGLLGAGSPDVGTA